MFASDWLDRGTSAANGRMAPYLEGARDALGSTFDYGNRALTDGLAASRALGENVFGSARRIARSTRDQIDGHPLETVLIVGLASFAIGWIAARRMRQAQARNGIARKPAKPRARPARGRTTRANA